MKTVKIGRSDIEIRCIGLGCWGIGGPFWDRGGWMGYGTAAFGPLRPEQMREIDSILASTE